MERWLKVSAVVLGILIVAMVAFLGAYVWFTVPNAENTYQQIVITDLQKGETEDGLATVEMRAEPHLYCPDREAVRFTFVAQFYNETESSERRLLGEVGRRFDVPRGGRNVTLSSGYMRQGNASADAVDAIRVSASSVADQADPSCREIAFPEELPPYEYWWNATETVNASNTTGSPESNATS